MWAGSTRMATDLAARMRRLDEIRPGVEQAVEQLSTLKGTRELLADGLEQMRVAYEEMTRLREGHGETQAWLANADVWTRKVQTQVKELSATGAGGRADPRRGGAGQGLHGADRVQPRDGARGTARPARGRHA